MSVTIKEVAKEANVSPSTVSRVLSDSSQISDRTKSSVREVIKKLKYKPNAIARSLVNKKSRILGVVIPGEAKDLLTNSFFMQVMKGMSRYAQCNKYYITYAFSEDEKAESEYISDFISSNLVDGVCLLRARSEDKSIQYLKDVGFPFVVIGRPEESEGTLWVDNYNFQIPPLSSIDIKASELGYYAIKILIDFLENNEITVNHYVIDSKLIKRKSFK